MMKPADFCIGLEFICGPFQYRCTDVGSRSVVAIRLVENDPVWHQGPPYMVQEVVLDELDLQSAFLTEMDAISAAINEHEGSGYPLFSSDNAKKLWDVKRKADRYPSSRRLLKFDRVRSDGEIVHPYSARKGPSSNPEEWLIQAFLPFTEEWIEIPEMEFLSWPLADQDSVRQRAERSIK